MSAAAIAPHVDERPLARSVAVAAPRESEAPMARHAAEVGLAAFVATATMLFTAFTAAYLIRRASLDFVPVRLPSSVWVGTGILALTSAALERARRDGTRARGSRAWLQASLALGLAFTCSQAFAWMQLRALGVFVASSPHASFFYILTGLHAAHVLGGLGALLVMLARPAPRVELAAWYWHFLGALWVYVLLLLTFA